jgi:NAD(P)H-flavin reductase
MNCSKCGHENAEDAKFCENCGSSLKQTPSKQGKSKIDNKILLIIVIAAIIGVAAIGSALNSANKSNNNQENYTYVTGVYDANGIYFELPEGWKARDGEENSSYIAAAFKEKSNNLKLFVHKDDHYNLSDPDNLQQDVEAETTYLRR